jgi:MOSC domain-containing protein YiiM
MGVWKIDTVLSGSVAPFGPGNRLSAIHKLPVDRPLRVGFGGLESDEHGDPAHHGGPDQAVHHYSFDNYTFWRAEFPGTAERFAAPGFFGENFSSTGFTEADICVGDVFRVGGALLQVSQARQPCWKLAFRSGVPDFALRVQVTARTGWFYRVLETGTVAAGDEIHPVERPNPAWDLKRLLAVMYASPLDRRELEEMISLPELSAGWRAIAERRLATGEVEPWHARVTLPSA